MIAIAFLLMAASTHLELANEVFQIPPGEWRYVELGLRQRPASVLASYEVEAGSQQVRLALMRREDLDRLREDLPAGVMVITPPARSGRLSYYVRVPGEYVLVIDNRASRAQAARAHLRIDLDFGLRDSPTVKQLSPKRQLLIMLISFAVFFVIAGYSARRLLHGIQR